MATRNFYLRNAKRYFVAAEPSETDADYSPFWYTELKDYLTEIAMDNGFEVAGGTADWLHDIECKANGTMRDYYATHLGCYLELFKDDKDGESWRVTIVPLLRNGYYSGAVLDYYIEVSDPCCNTIENEDVENGNVIDGLIDDYFKDMEELGYDGASAFGIKDLLDELIEQAKDTFYKFAEATGLDEYVLGGTFSNGEGVYINKTELAKKALKKGEQQ